MIESARSDDAVNMVIMFQRFAQRLQQDRAYSFSGNKSISSLPITLTFAIERQHPAATERLVFVRMQIEIDAACNGELATPVADAFTREMEGHEGRRTSRINRHAWAGEIKKVGNAICDGPGHGAGTCKVPSVSLLGP